MPNKLCRFPVALITILILSNLYTLEARAADTLKSEAYISRFGNLDNVLYRIKKEKAATVAFLGGSITHMIGWRDMVCNYLLTTYPETHFTFINAGIASLGSLPHAFRLEQDVLSKGRVDLLFVESAVNDQTNGTPEVIQRRSLEGIVRHAFRTNPKINIILLVFADESKIADYKKKVVPLEVRVHQDIAQTYHLPFINLAREVHDRIEAGEFSWNNDFKDVHPSPFGQALYFKTIKQLLSVSFERQVPKRLTKVKLPQSLDPSNYANGTYIDIHLAKNLNLFHVDELWQPGDSLATRAGFVHVPVLVAENPAASLELKFKGEVIGLCVVAGRDAGIIKYSIDGREQPEVNLYTPWSKGLHIPWYVLLSDSLGKGDHQLKLTVSNNHHLKSTGTACRIVYFFGNAAK